MDNVYLIDGATLDDIARQVQRLRNTDEPMTPAQIKSELASIVFQEKIVAPTTEQQIVTPDPAYSGLSSVTVEAAPLQGKEVTPGAQPQTIVPDSNYYGLSAVNIGAVRLQKKTVTPTNERQIVTPDVGYHGLSGVTVEGTGGGGDSSGGSLLSTTITDVVENRIVSVIVLNATSNLVEEAEE